MIMEYQLYKNIEKMKQDNQKFENKYNKGNELIQVQETLNNRIITIKEQILEEPENKNLNLELTFCQSEIERLNQELEEFQHHYNTKEAQKQKHQEIIEYNLQDLYQYIEYLEELETNKQLTQAIKETTEKIEDNIRQLQYLK